MILTEKASILPIFHWILSQCPNQQVPSSQMISSRLTFFPTLPPFPPTSNAANLPPIAPAFVTPSSIPLGPLATVNAVKRVFNATWDEERSEFNSNSIQLHFQNDPVRINNCLTALRDHCRHMRQLITRMKRELLSSIDAAEQRNQASRYSDEELAVIDEFLENELRDISL